MIQKFLSALTVLAAAIFSGRQQIQDRDKIITDLRAALDAENADDAALEAAKTKADADLAALNAGLKTVDEEVDRVLASISEDKGIPIVIDPGTGATEPQPVADGTHTVEYGFTSRGKEGYSVIGSLSGTNDKQVEALRDVMRRAVVAAQEQPALDVSLESKLILTVDGTEEIAEPLTDLGPKVAADVAGLRALLELAEAQADELGVQI